MCPSRFGLRTRTASACRPCLPINRVVLNKSNVRQDGSLLMNSLHPAITTASAPWYLPLLTSALPHATTASHHSRSLSDDPATFAAANATATGPLTELWHVEQCSHSRTGSHCSAEFCLCAATKMRHSACASVRRRDTRSVHVACPGVACNRGACRCARTLVCAMRVVVHKKHSDDQGCASASAAVHRPSYTRCTVRQCLCMQAAVRSENNTMIDSSAHSVEFFLETSKRLTRCVVAF
jgi:hypothetical protein